MKPHESFQLPLPGFNWKKTGAFGGAVMKKSGGAFAKGNPRKARPVATKRPMHLVLKSKIMGGKKSFYLEARNLDALCKSTGKKSRVQVKNCAVGSDHLHLIIQAYSGKAYKNFVRALSGLIARKMLNAEKGRPSEFAKHFWEARPFSRILDSAEDLKSLAVYLEQFTTFSAVSGQPPLPLYPAGFS